MKKLFIIIVAMFAVISINADDEVTLWEGTITSTGWSGQSVLSDGGTELKNANAKVGDDVVFYLSGDEGWSTKIVEGHWGPEYVAFNAESLNADGAASLTLTQEILDSAYKQKWWGGTFILNGDGNVTLTKVTLVHNSTTVTVGGNGYSTFSAARNFTVNGAEAYYVKSEGVAGSKVTLTKITSDSVIPANEGIILKTKNKGDEIIVKFTSYEAETLSNNLLKPVLTATQAFETSGTNYVLASSSDGSETAFYKTTNSDDTWTKLQGKCYLNVPSGSNAKLNVVIGETTGINGIENANHKSQTSSLNSKISYNLAGQQVPASTKGIVIINGKKYINK